MIGVYGGEFVTQKIKNGVVRPPFEKEKEKAEYIERLKAKRTVEAEITEENGLTKAENAELDSYLEELERRIGDYAFTVDERQDEIEYCFGHENASILNFVNHGHEITNVAPEYDVENKQIVFYAERDIKEGEELLFNYGATYGVEKFEHIFPIGIRTSKEFYQQNFEEYGCIILLSKENQQLLGTSASHLLIPKNYGDLRKNNTSMRINSLPILEMAQEENGELNPLKKQNFITQLMYAFLEQDEEIIESYIKKEVSLAFVTQGGKSALSIANKKAKTNPKLAGLRDRLVAAIKHSLKGEGWNEEACSKYLAANGTSIDAGKDLPESKENQMDLERSLRMPINKNLEDDEAKLNKNKNRKKYKKTEMAVSSKKRSRIKSKIPSVSPKRKKTTELELPTDLQNAQDQCAKLNTPISQISSILNTGSFLEKSEVGCLEKDPVAPMQLSSDSNNRNKLEISSSENNNCPLIDFDWKQILHNSTLTPQEIYGLATMPLISNMGDDTNSGTTPLLPVMEDEIPTPIDRSPNPTAIPSPNLPLSSSRNSISVMKSKKRKRSKPNVVSSATDSKKKKRTKSDVILDDLKIDQYDTLKKLLPGIEEDDFKPLLRKYSSDKKIAALIEHSKWLCDKSFTKKQIIQMVSKRGGDLILQAVKDNFQSLTTDFKFTPDQICKIVSHHGGSHNLKAVKNNFTILKGIGFTPDQICKIASYTGGSHNLEAVKNNFTILEGIGFDCDSVTKIASQPGASLILELLKKYAGQIDTHKIKPKFFLNLRVGGRLPPAKKMEPLLEEEIKKRKNSLKNLDKVDPEAKTPVQLSSDSKDLSSPETADPSTPILPPIVISSHKKKGQKSKRESSLAKILRKSTNNKLIEKAKFHFSADQIAKILSAPKSGQLNLEAGLKYFNNFDFMGKEMPFSTNQVVKILSRTAGHLNLEAGLKYFNDFMGKEMPFSTNQVVKILSRTAGHLSLEAGLEYFRGEKKPFSTNQITQMLSKDCGHLNLRAVLECFNVLEQMNIQPDLMTRLASSNGGGLKIRKLTEYRQKLEPYQPLKPEFYSSLKRDISGTVGVNKMEIRLKNKLKEMEEQQAKDVLNKDKRNSKLSPPSATATPSVSQTARYRFLPPPRQKSNDKTNLEGLNKSTDPTEKNALSITHNQGITK